MSDDDRNRIQADLSSLSPGMNDRQLALAGLMVPKVRHFIREEEGYDAAFGQQFAEGVQVEWPNLDKLAASVNQDVQATAVLVACLDAVEVLGEDFDAMNPPAAVQEKIDEFVSSASEEGVVYEAYGDASQMAQCINNDGLVSQLSFLLAGNGLFWFKDFAREVTHEQEIAVISKYGA